MFLKLIYEDKMKKLAFHDSLRNLDNLRNLVKGIKTWNLQDFDLKVMSQNNSLKTIENDIELFNLPLDDKDTRFAVVHVLKRELADIKHGNRHFDEFIDYGSLNIKSEYFDDTSHYFAKNDANDHIFINESVNDNLADDMKRLNINNEMNDHLPENNHIAKKEIVDNEQLIKSEFMTYKIKTENPEQIEQYMDIIEPEVKTEENRRVGLKPRKRQLTDTENTENKEKKGPKLRKRLRKLKKQIVENDKKTKQLIDERFATLENQITELKKLFNLSQKPDTTELNSQNTQIKCIITHYGVECDGCSTYPIVGKRFRCMTCENYDLCEVCENKCVHNHPMMRIMTVQNNQVVDLVETDKSNRRNLDSQSVDIYINNDRLDTSIISSKMQIEESVDISEQRRLKIELLDFMFGNTMDDAKKEQLVEKYWTWMWLIFVLRFRQAGYNLIVRYSIL